MILPFGPATPLMSLIPRSWWVILGLVLTNVVTFSLWRHSANSFVDYRSEVAAAGASQAAQTEAIVKQQKQITEDTTNGWKAALDYVRADYARRLRQHASAGTLSGISPAPRSVDDLTADALPLAEQCAETTLQLITLQRWVRQQESLQ